VVGSFVGKDGSLGRGGEEEGVYRMKKKEL
jgi:hypothetical protein